MQVAPVSADLLIKITVGAAVVGGLLYLVQKVAGSASAALGDVVDTVTESAATTFNPASPENFVYKGANAIGEAVTSPDSSGRNADGSFTWGGWLYDVTHPGTVAQIKEITAPAGGTSGSW